VCRFHVLRSRTRFQRNRGRLLLFSCLAFPDSFSGGTVGAGSRFHVLRVPDSFSAVSRASGLDFMFCAPELVFDGAECVGSRFHVLRVRTHFRWYRGRPIPLSCFMLPDMFLVVRRASGPVFMFCTLGHVFGDTEGVESRFHILCSRTRFWRYRGCRVPFSYFALPGTVSVVMRASGLDFIFLRSRTRFRQYRGRRVPFSCFALPNSSSAVLRSTCPVFLFCAPRHVYGGSEAVESNFQALCSRSRFPRY
jgi:hypothetical protein